MTVLVELRDWRLIPLAAEVTGATMGHSARPRAYHCESVFFDVAGIDLAVHEVDNIGHNPLRPRGLP
jgi:hypothetical protein